MKKAVWGLLIVLALHSAYPASAFAQDSCEVAFFSLIQRTPGTAAPDWEAVLEDLHYTKGVPKNPAPGPLPRGGPFNDLYIMIDAGGDARGRIWYASDVPQVDHNGNQWYTAERQVIATRPGSPVECHLDANACVWTFEHKGGEPRPCVATPPPTTPPPVVIPPVVTPPGGQLPIDVIAELVGRLFQLEQLVAKVDALQASIDAASQHAASALRATETIRDQILELQARPLPDFVGTLRSRGVTLGTIAITPKR